MARPWLSTRMSHLSIFFFFFFILFLCAPFASSRTDFVHSECLKVPSSVFVSSVKSTIDAIRKVITVVSQFTNAFGDFRLSTAISDCLDLLEFSTDELTWSLSATQNPNGKYNGTGNLNADMRTWLSAARANQDTCINGFDGTNGIVKELVGASLDQVSSLVHDLLSMVQQVPKAKSQGGSTSSGGGRGDWEGRKLKSNDEFPSWIKLKDRKLVEGSSSEVWADVTVALDGSGNYTSVMDAVLAAPDYSMSRYVIYVKRGVYRENVEIKKKKWNLMLIGDGMDVTVISGNRNFIDGWTTFRSATFAVSGKGFIARDVTFENSAGPQKHQAVALRSDSDLSVFFRCGIKGYQDTLYTHTMRQFYRECQISGTVDFIFGDATAVFQNCQILAKKGLPNQKNTITAQGRKDPYQTTGFSIQFCNISADSDLIASMNATPTYTYTYLGRPWKLYSRTIIMQSYMSNVIRPEGWLEWNGNFALDTLLYGEYMNYGPGAGLGSRVKWPGYRAINDSSLANNFTVAQFIQGNLWLPSTGVRYTAGLVV